MPQRSTDPNDIDPTPVTPVRRSGRSTDPNDVDPPDAGGVNPWMAAAGVAGVGLAGLALHNPGMVKKAASTLAETALAARYIPMLSGFAAPKSLMGNVGAGIVSSAERGSMEPLKELFSMQTARDFAETFKHPENHNTPGSIASMAGALNPFGRIMGAGDVATRNALGRAGLTGEEAMKQVLQEQRFDPKTAKVLQHPLTRIPFPFTKTPQNQLWGGFEGAIEHPAVAATSFGAGYATGANTDNPVTPGLLSPLAGRHGLAFTLGAVAQRVANDRPDALRVGLGASPTSDSAILDPVRALANPRDLLMHPGKLLPKAAYHSVLKYLGLESE